MGLVDIVVGTAATGYLGFRMMNKALERVFFVNGRTNFGQM